MNNTGPLDRPLGAFFLIAFAWTWGLAALFIFAPDWVERVIGPVGPRSPLFFVAVYGPTVAAILVTGFTAGRAGVMALLGKLVRWRFSPLWYAFALIGVPLLATVAGHLGEYVMGIEPPPHIARIPAFLTALPIVLVLDPGPLGEELGWRGFALPRMAARWGLPLASTMLGLIWGAWHYPVFRIPGMSQSSLSFPVFMVGAIVLSVIVAWLVMRTGGSVLIAVLFHLAVNLSLGVFQPPFPMFVVVLGVVAAAILAFDKRFRSTTLIEAERAMTQPGEEFLLVSRRYLRGDYLPRILVCLETLEDTDVWWRMNEASNSIGNLVLHLCGNARQWIVAGVGGAPDIRKRQTEFDQRAVIPREELSQRLRTTLFEVDDTLAAVDPSTLLDARRIQGLDTTVMGAIYHVVEHFSTHTGQIVMLTKQRTGRDLGFWEARADGTVARRWKPL